jgi:hypothetical protein
MFLMTVVNVGHTVMNFIHKHEAVLVTEGKGSFMLRYMFLFSLERAT